MTDSDCPICNKPGVTLRSCHMTHGNVRTWEELSVLEVFNWPSIESRLMLCRRCWHYWRTPLFDERDAYSEAGAAIQAKIYARFHPDDEEYRGGCGGGRPEMAVWAQGNRSTFRHLANVFERIPQTPQWNGPLKVLDWGGGDGYLVELVAMSSSRVLNCPVEGYCFDSVYSGKSPYFRQIGDAEIPEKGPYHLVLLSHVLEHVREPVAMLKQIRTNLRPDGMLIVIVPYEPYRVFSPIGVGPQYHQHMFTPRSLQRALAVAGMSAKPVAYRSFHRTIPIWNIQATVTATAASSGSSWIMEPARFIQAMAWALWQRIGRKRTVTSSEKCRKPASRLTHKDPIVQTDLAKRVAEEKAFHNTRFPQHSETQTGSKYYLALQDWYRDYFRLVMRSPSRHVLELGSGVESLALQIGQADFAFDSINISEEAITYAKAHTRLPQASFSVDDAHHTKFADGTFDLVIGRGILHHLDIPLACAENKRLLQPGGKIVFGEPLDCNVLINLYRKLTPKIRSKDARPLSTEALALLGSHFGKLDINYYRFLTLGPSILRRRSPRWLHGLDHFLLNTLGLGRFLAWACLISSPASKP